MKIFCNNVMNKTNTTAPGATVQMPCANLFEKQLCKKVRMTGSKQINVKLIEAQDVNSCIIAGHNAESATLEAATDEAFANKVYSAQIPKIGSVFYLNLVAPIFARYYRITFSGGAYIDVGKVFLGRSTEMPPMEPSQQIELDSTEKAELSRSGQLYSTDGYVPRVVKVDFPALSSQERVSIEDLFRSVGKGTPFFMFMLTDRHDIVPPIWCHIKDKVQFKRTGNAAYPFSTDITFEEVF